ncbi:uncharacterized protein FA14DRAFT_124304 [Meira miltonrushii]|uniref:Rhodanese domain-containing protein n=1 Tax=Meira miltonrushii TaxID=1280837 RepID=A0A316VEA8_9BASI|nr:uncharacterized protein FA14DRAFT_124304 [Meira miltonrushii]PWN33805.1 hypothetical protein FA14DRAFT_124304 [Meira miltonrushii]
MSLGEYSRYGRQMILPSMGLPGQLKLRKSRVLVIGAGGLGCPSIQYLVAAGVGHITVLDHDTVEKSNLARQILHTDDRVGMNKAVSVSIASKIINPFVHVEPVQTSLSVENAVPLIKTHDIVLDCTDNVLTRYLISDAAVKCGRQVVSGAAQGFDGQLVVLHKDLRPAEPVPRGPCYRCLFPKAPKPEEVTDCEDGGVLGTITGLVGTMQAFETIKLLTGIGDDDEDDKGRPIVGMTLVSPLSFPPSRSVRLRPRRITTCRACGDPEQMQADLNYIAFCGLTNGRTLDGFDEITTSNFAKLNGRPQSKAHIIDVRPKVEFEIAQLPNTTNIPFRQIDSDPKKWYTDILKSIGNTQDDHQVYVLCRRGNDSRLASDKQAKIRFTNITGGLRAWSNEVDKNFPVY